MTIEKDNHDELYDQMKSTSNDAIYQPSSETWDRLEEMLDKSRPTKHRPYKIFGLTTDWRIAAGLLLLFGLGGLMMTQKSPFAAKDQTAIQLEDLHTLQVNPRYHTPHVNDATTIPSSIFMNTKSPAKVIEEGTSEQKIVVRKEYGMG